MRLGVQEDHSESCCNQEPCMENTYQNHYNMDKSSLVQCLPVLSKCKKVEAQNDVVEEVFS